MKVLKVKFGQWTNLSKAETATELNNFNGFIYLFMFDQKLLIKYWDSRTIYADALVNTNGFFAPDIDFTYFIKRKITSLCVSETGTKYVQETLTKLET